MAGICCTGSRRRDAYADDPPRTYEALTGQLLLDNNRVYVEKFSLQPGQSTGKHQSGNVGSNLIDLIWVTLTK